MLVFDLSLLIHYNILLNYAIQVRHRPPWRGVLFTTPPQHRLGVLAI